MQKYDVATAILHGILLADVARCLPIAERNHIQTIGRNPERHQNIRDLLCPSGTDVLIIRILAVPIGIPRQQ